MPGPTAARTQATAVAPRSSKAAPKETNSRRRDSKPLHQLQSWVVGTEVDLDTLRREELDLKIRLKSLPSQEERQQIEVRLQQIETRKRAIKKRRR